MSKHHKKAKYHYFHKDWVNLYMYYENGTFLGLKTMKTKLIIFH